MAAYTKAAITLQASASNAAAATATGTGVDLTTALGAVVTGRITNGGTGPTVGCDFILETSNDNATWRELVRVTAPVAASTSYDFPVEIPDAVMYVRSRFTGNTAQAVTVECLGSKISTLA